MMKKWFTLMLSLLLCAAVSAQGNVSVTGTSANAAGKRIELRCYSDMLTQSEVLLDEAVIDASGAFRLETYLRYPRLVFLQVENYSQSFYAEPGRRYEVWLPQFDWEQDERVNVFLQPVALEVEFLNLPADELNLKIKCFDEAVEAFLDSNRVHLDFRFKPDRRWMDSLERAVGAQWPSVGEGSDFFSRYARFSLAEMRMAMFPGSRKQLVERYIKGQPVLYHDENYMRLFLSLYGDWVRMGTKRLPLSRLTAWVAAGDLDRYLDSLGVEPLLVDEQVRELAALEALKESYYDARYDRAGVVKMVRLLGERTKFKEHGELAGRVLAEIDRVFAESNRDSQRNTEYLALNTIELPDVDGRRVSLDSLAGKWVYLSFVRVDDPNSLREIETMAHFRDSVYGKYPEVEFVSIVCDREFQKMYHFLRNSKRGGRYKWLWLHFDGDYRLLERFGVVSYPTFVLINPEGRQQYELTPAPATGFLLNAPWQRKEEREKDSWGEGMHGFGN